MICCVTLFTFKNMKIHFISLYAPNSKFKLHHKRIFCRTYEFTRTVFSRQRLKRQKMSDSLLNEHSTTLISATNRSNMILCIVRNSGLIFLHNCCTRITYFYRAEETVYMTLLFLLSQKRKVESMHCPNNEVFH